MNPRKFLDEFVALHRGTRAGRVFGQPAAFAGHRVFARVSPHGLEYRALTVRPSRRRGPKSDLEWILARPITDRDYATLVQLLERAVEAVVTAR